jgi:NAD(P)-dependent dehydrogenase (short-subunit alcohol dehydrogenase family)
MGTFSGTSVVITGAAHGQGRSHALRFAELGADVVCIDICRPIATVNYPTATPDELAETVREVEKFGVRAAGFEVDVRDLAALHDVAAEVESSLPPVGTVVANAGISTYARLLEVTPDQWTDIVEVNLRGPFHTVQAFAPGMIRSGLGGSIVLISSVAGTKALPFCGPYTAAKHGLQGLAKAFAQELGSARIRVNTVNPGSVRSVLTTQDPSFGELLADREEDSDFFNASFAPILPMPADGMLDAARITDAVVWLASPASEFVTGAVIPVDAGVTIR